MPASVGAQKAVKNFVNASCNAICLRAAISSWDNVTLYQAIYFFPRLVLAGVILRGDNSVVLSLILDSRPDARLRCVDHAYPSAHTEPIIGRAWVPNLGWVGFSPARGGDSGAGWPELSSAAAPGRELWSAQRSRFERRLDDVPYPSSSPVEE